VGGAEISAKHANFIINRGGATAQDVLALLELAFERVPNQTGIRLTTELRIMGD
jgi:UDP-N-acetylmuramate dehydrogenase